MNTSEEQPPASLPETITAPPVTKLDETAAALERQLQGEREGRRTERFYWIFFASLLIDMIALPHTGLIAIPLLLMQVVLLIGVAGAMGIDVVVVLLRRVFDRLLKELGKDDE